MTQTALLNDYTLRFTGYSNVLAFVVVFISDTVLFVSMGWFHDEDDDDNDGRGPPIVFALVYIVGSFFNSMVMTLGLGYVALAHNLFAAQLLNVTHQLEHLILEGQEQSASPDIESYGATLFEGASPQNQPGGSSPGDETASLVVVPSSSSNVEHLTVDSLGRQYAEFRRRQDTLARTFHPRVLFIVLTSGITIILMVTEGFQANKDSFTNLEIGTLITLFLGSAYSLWTVIFSMGRVPFVSREECAFSAHKWALFKEPAAMPLALTMSQFPITFHVGPFEWSSEVSKAFTIFLLSLAGIFVGIHIPEFD
jgi:hypothetical protein